MTDNGKWQVAWMAIMVTLVLASFGWTSWCFFTNQAKIEANACARQVAVITLMEKYENLRAIANDSLHSIDKRLSRIEDKIGLK